MGTSRPVDTGRTGHCGAKAPARAKPRASRTLAEPVPDGPGWLVRPRAPARHGGGDGVKTIMSQPVRAWAYRVGMAAIPLLVAYGLLDDGTAGLWVGVLGAALGFGLPAMAAVNTPAKPRE